MKIYDKIVISMITGKTLKENSFKYDGEVAQCCMDGGTTVEAPQPTAQEIELQKMQLAILKEQQVDAAALRPFILDVMGLKTDAEGNIIQLSEEEKLASMTEQERGAYDILMAQQERAKKALAGELEISPALEKNLAERERMMVEALSQKLGSNWMQTTAGQQAMATFTRQAELLREEARRGELTGGMGLYLSHQQQYQGDISGQRKYGQGMGFSGAKAGLFSQAGQAQQPYQYQRGLQYQANVANAPSKAGLLKGYGDIVGSGIQAYGLYKGLTASATLAASSRVLKKNIKTITCPLERLDQIRGVVFDWKDESGHDTGVIAEEIEGAVPGLIEEVDGIKHVYYYKMIPLLIEVVKSQQKQISKLMGE